jgi:ABC-type nitrate/sulfonate/bicarbonate transport system ATPase subunit
MKFQGESKLWSIVRDWVRYQDILTDWLTVSRNVTLTLTNETKSTYVTFTTRRRFISTMFNFLNQMTSNISGST